MTTQFKPISQLLKALLFQGSSVTWSWFIKILKTQWNANECPWSEKCAVSAEWMADNGVLHLQLLTLDNAQHMDLCRRSL